MPTYIYTCWFWAKGEPSCGAQVGYSEHIPLPFDMRVMPALLEASV